jgi:hypothetical protein
MSINPLFFLATATFGWGLSLATYRAVASRNGWPMGDPQAHHPLFVVLIGIVALITSFLFAVYGHTSSIVTGWAMIGLGLLFGLFWTGFLRVASQTALFLAPLATFLLLLGWASTDDLAGDMKTISSRIVESEKRLQNAISDRVQDALQARRDQAAQPPVPGAPSKPYQPQ